MFAIANGRLMIDGTAVPFLPTPNQGGHLEATLIVLHDTAGRLSKGSAITWLRDPEAKASAHVVVERDGSIAQLVTFDRVAWHAGQSQWRGRSGCNAFSIGIEIVNPGKLAGTPEKATAWFGQSFGREFGIVHASTPVHGDGCWMPYTEAQLHAVEQLIAALGWEYPIGEVVAHHDIAPGRKVDTTPLMDWPRMRAALESGDDDGREQADANAAARADSNEPKPTIAPAPQRPATPAAATPPSAPPPVTTSSTRWPAWKIPLAFAAAGGILWALIAGKINSEDAQRLFQHLVQ
jgi:N-acetylmuramoyl-L-alanine amidase